MRINVDVGRSVKFDLRLILETSNLSIVNLQYSFDETGYGMYCSYDHQRSQGQRL